MRKFFIEFPNTRFIEEDPVDLLRLCSESDIGSPLFYEYRGKLIERYIPHALSVVSNFINSDRKHLREELCSLILLELVIAVDNLIKKKSHENISAYITMTLIGKVKDYFNDRKKSSNINIDISSVDNEEDIWYNMVTTNSNIDKIEVDDIIHMLSLGHKKLSGIDSVISSSVLLEKRYYGLSNSEISDYIFTSTGRRYTTSRVDQMIKRVFDYTKNVCKA